MSESLQHPQATPVYHNPNLPHHYHLLIPEANGGTYQVLLQADGERWRLPSFVPSEHHFSVVQHINDAVLAHYGLSVATLRCFSTQNHPERGELRFYALDNLSTTTEAPDGMRWFSEDDLYDLSLSSQLEQQIMLEWFQWRYSDDSARSDWMRPGWYLKMAHWLIDLADRMSMTALGQPTQERLWARSATMRLNTEQGALYLKAVPQFFNYEPVITRVLSIRYPDHAPDVRAVHVENGWMLMHEFKGKTLTQFNNLEMWIRAVKEFARMQIDLISNTQSLIALGVPDRNVDYLASQIPRLMNDLPVGLSAQERHDLQQVAPTLHEMCHQLAEFDIPLTLTHGDFWSGQVVFKDDDKCLFFDWSDASISHPFFDMATFLSEVDYELPHIPDARQQLLMIYLNEWTRYASLPTLKQAYALAMTLTYLHQALFYYVHILPRMETVVRWELSGMLTHLLRHVLHEMRAFSD
ncbi:MAG: phosphotransferase family protein [Anaerolineae bacterium]